MNSPITMIGGLKPEYYIPKRILIFLFLTKFSMAQKRPIDCPDLPTIVQTQDRILVLVLSLLPYYDHNIVYWY